MIHDIDIGAASEGIPAAGPCAHSEIDRAARHAGVRALIRSGQIRLGGNRILKIYGTLSCSSGKRMKADNRVFFVSEAEAKEAGYRPCGHCMKKEYQQWKSKKKKP